MIWTSESTFPASCREFKRLKDRCIGVKINAAKGRQSQTFVRKVAAATGSMREGMSRFKCLACRKQSSSTPQTDAVLSDIEKVCHRADF